ncbi:hypothetical protein LWI28_029029 [Acer negundo]|uniref:Cytochrome P450 n=1 Tax=Acer negundo TaxID=4023 RepID=A0AAD5JFL2_ACENE|nr:hypothetical protein LWI28_029029 [Acer negundo]KAK4856159.1 hypothetical protein QYF36_014706 [Acer negundo]
MAPLFLVLVAIVVIFISHTLYSVFFNEKSYVQGNVPPGGRGWPFIGETLEYLSLGKKNNIEKFIYDRKNKYNARHFFKTSYIGENMLFACTTEANKFVFVTANKFVRSWWPKSMEKVLPSTEKTSTVQESSRSRRIAVVFNEPFVLQKYVGMFDEVAKAHIQKNWNDQQVVKVYPLAKKFSFALACRTILNVSDTQLVEEFEKLFICLSAGFFSLPVNLPGTKLNRAIKAAKELRRRFEVIIREGKRRNNIIDQDSKSEEARDLLNFLLQEKYANGEYMNDSDVANMTLGILIAGYEAASTTIVSIMKFLAELPDVYERVRQEQMEILNSKPPGELLNMSDIKKMKYSWNVASEALRLLPPVAGTFREAIRDLSYDGLTIPKGWKMHWNPHATHKNPVYFPDPYKFDPSRFEGNGPPLYSYVPFGGGPHICPGREFAKIQMLVFMHNVVTNFKWKKVFPDEQIIVDPVLVPTKGLPVRLQPHQQPI